MQTKLALFTGVTVQRGTHIFKFLLDKGNAVHGIKLGLQGVNEKGCFSSLTGAKCDELVQKRGYVVSRNHE